MTRIKAYIFVESQYIDAVNASNIHIFEGYYVVETKKAVITSDESKSLCGKYTVKKPWCYSEIALGNSDEDRLIEARKIAIGFENEGKTICGQCASVLFADEGQ